MLETDEGNNLLCSFFKGIHLMLLRIARLDERIAELDAERLNKSNYKRYTGMCIKIFF